MSRLEVAVLAIMIVVVTWFMFANQRRQTYDAGRLRCISHLKQINLAFRIFASDNLDKYPFHEKRRHLYGTGNEEGQGGNPLLSQNLDVETWHLFQVLSNELADTRILLCPKDRQRSANQASDFLQETNSLSAPGKRDLAVSYFVGLNATEIKPQSILIGDRNITGPATGPAKDAEAPYLPGGTQLLRPDSRHGAQRRWSTAVSDTLHGDQGNLNFADGSVRQTNGRQLEAALKFSREEYGTNTWLFSFPNER